MFSLWGGLVPRWWLWDWLLRELLVVYLFPGVVRVEIVVGDELGALHELLR